MDEVLAAYSIKSGTFTIMPLGSGLINSTWKVSTREDQFVLQKINQHVFKKPEDIAENLKQLSSYLELTAPDYLFPSPLATAGGNHMVVHHNEYYRLSPFVIGSHTIDTVKNAGQAYKAAQQFGRFTRLLSGFNAVQLKYTIPDFHNLGLRYQQFDTALRHANPDRLNIAREIINVAKKNRDIVKIYKSLVNNRLVNYRTVHHDTKLNNVLFDHSGNAICIVDLDTIMPGYYISDVGDMMRTYLSPVDEEERDFSKIVIRPEIFEAIYGGYMREMADLLTDYEKSIFIFSGKFIIYMQALRFLTDYLNNDMYYPTADPEHNLFRARNQFALLKAYNDSEECFEHIIKKQISPNAPQ